MPSKSVSFSDDGYVRLIQEQPEDVGFSEWVEKLAIKGLDARDDAQTTEQQSKEVS